MSTFTDTTVRVSLATPDDIRELSQKSLHLWVGAMSPLWAPFWAAASFGVGMWALGQGAARTLGGTLYDKDLPLVLKWPGFDPSPRSVEALSDTVEKTAAIVEDTVIATTDAVEKAGVVAAEAAEAVADDVQETQAVVADAIEEVADTAATESVSKAESVAELVEETQAEAAKAVETAVDTTDAVTSKAAKISATSAKKAAEATLDLLAGQSTVEAATPARDTRPLIDPVTAMPVIPAVVEAAAEPKLPMPKASPRRPRKG